MISFADAPFIVTLRDGTKAADEGEILLLGVDGPSGLILAARELLWVPLNDLLVETSLTTFAPVDESE